MEAAFDQASIRLTLMKAVQNGRFTVDALDNPSPGFQSNYRVHPRSFRNGYEGVQFKNLLRDTVVEEAVQVINPKDLPPLETGITPAQTSSNLPITLETEPTPEDLCPF